MIKALIQFTFWYMKLMFKIIFWPIKLIYNAFKEEHDSYKNDTFASTYTPPTFSDEIRPQKALDEPEPPKIRPFGDWPAYIHAEPDQKSRQYRAMSNQYVPITLDRKAKSGTFRGSNGETYNTTLETCTCMDFKKRNRPCKHIYRLAIELGY